ncbi:MAG: aminoacyl--tRNA ligase-related protein [Candidatus Nanohaloarchaea archaeon]
MRRSNLFATTSKEAEADTDCASEELAIRAGLIHSYGSGTFGFTNLGLRVVENIEEVIRNEMDRIGQEVKMNILQKSDIWKKSGRWENFEGEEFFSLENREGKKFTIAATHEETAVELVRKYIRSYRDLDLTIYQIGRKFRDDHARKGLIRGKEFVMKDAYSFHEDREGLDRKYQKVVEVYRNIFDRLGLEYSEVSADNGDMGGSGSHEFIAESEVGSDTYLKCESRECSFGTKDLEVGKCRECGSDLREVNGIEVGHCFKLGDRYTAEDSMDLTFTTGEGVEQEVLMGCYGIGVSRLISTIIEQNHDERGIAWNREVSAFDTSIIVARHEEEVMEKAEDIYQELRDSGIEVILYDEERSAGEKFRDSDLLGIRRKLIVGKNFIEEDTVEIETRDGEKERFDSEEVVEELT